MVVIEGHTPEIGGVSVCSLLLILRYSVASCVAFALMYCLEHVCARFAATCARPLRLYRRTVMYCSL